MREAEVVVVTSDVAGVAWRGGGSAGRGLEGDGDGDFEVGAGDDDVLGHAEIRRAEGPADDRGLSGGDAGEVSGRDVDDGGGEIAFVFDGFVEGLDGVGRAGDLDVREGEFIEFELVFVAIEDRAADENDDGDGLWEGLGLGGSDLDNRLDGGRGADDDEWRGDDLDGDVDLMRAFRQVEDLLHVRVDFRGGAFDGGLRAFDGDLVRLELDGAADLGLVGGSDHDGDGEGLLFLDVDGDRGGASVRDGDGFAGEDVVAADPFSDRDFAAEGGLEVVGEGDVKGALLVGQRIADDSEAGSRAFEFEEDLAVFGAGERDDAVGGVGAEADGDGDIGDDLDLLSLGVDPDERGEGQDPEEGLDAVGDASSGWRLALVAGVGQAAG